jgi:hypothetical protein
LITPQVLRRLRDGRRLIRVPVRDPKHPSRVVAWLEIREIRLRVGRRGHRAQVLRLWTSLLDPRTAPALELAQLYARRWEHELYDSLDNLAPDEIAQIWAEEAQRRSDALDAGTLRSRSADEVFREARARF